MFPDVPPGLYVVKVQRDGFADTESAPFTVGSGKTEQVLIEMRLTFVRESVEVVAPANSPTESLQPVAVSDVLTGAKMDIQPLAGDDFQSLLDGAPEHHPRPGWPTAGEGRCPDNRRATAEQRQSERSHRLVISISSCLVAPSSR